MFDHTDAAILGKRMAVFDARPGPRVGDYVIMPDGGKERFSHDWGDDDGLQTARGGSFYLGDGYASFSGTLNPIIKRNRLIDTGAREDARFWFFHHDHHIGHNGVDVEAPVRVFVVSNAAVGGLVSPSPIKLDVPTLE
ncbi:MAG: hypothetical protein ACYDAG_02440 [Chloroflexota bacterium]